MEVEAVPLLKFDVQKFPDPSRTTPNGPLPVEKRDTAAPVEGFTLVTVLTPLLATHTVVASEVIPAAPSPTLMEVEVKPSVLNLVKVPSKKFETKMLPKADSTPNGPRPAAKVPSTVPVAASSFVTVFPWLLATHTLAVAALYATPTGR